MRMHLCCEIPYTYKQTNKALHIHFPTCMWGVFRSHDTKMHKK